MPGGNGTGPMGLGQMTGRGAGYCAGLAAPGYLNTAGFVCGFGCGAGRGRRRRRILNSVGAQGWIRNGFPEYAGLSTAAFDEETFLTNQMEYLEEQLSQIKDRLSRLSEESD